MILKTERLILRPWTEDDAEDMFRYAKDERVASPAGWKTHTSLEYSQDKLIKSYIIDENYAICLKEDNRPIGDIEIMIGADSNLPIGENEGEVGFWLGVPFWGMGIASEALNEICRHSFCDLGLDKLWCEYFDGNKRSKRTMEKCGFVYHHTNRDTLWETTGEIRTEHVTCLEKEKWLKK